MNTPRGILREGLIRRNLSRERESMNLNWLLIKNSSSHSRKKYPKNMTVKCQMIHIRWHGTQQKPHIM
jgi:hypothetical protein